MPQQTSFMVHHFDRRVRELVRRPAVEFRTSAEATARAAQDADFYSGVVAFEVVVDADTREPIEPKRVLARFGEIGQEFQED